MARSKAAPSADYITSVKKYGLIKQNTGLTRRGMSLESTASISIDQSRNQLQAMAGDKVRSTLEMYEFSQKEQSKLKGKMSKLLEASTQDFNTNEALYQQQVRSALDTGMSKAQLLTYGIQLATLPMDKLALALSDKTVLGALSELPPSISGFESDMMAASRDLYITNNHPELVQQKKENEDDQRLLKVVALTADSLLKDYDRFQAGVDINTQAVEIA